MKYVSQHFTTEQIEWLKNYFMAKPEIVSSLPDAKSEESEVKLFVLKNDNSKKLYCLTEGQYYFIKDLT